ncbi:hypothetical protein GCM10010345_21280 [Streptomyces canarius]|uniref:Uncharacterized protein n=1 Tax=Streptomyces canarius TaxID=285453 RepID=A0ABQ3CJ03_9ACTN|nr:hypothetical protein GCM10010345_21280 [Streptomyces canarius]
MDWCCVSIMGTTDKFFTAPVEELRPQQRVLTLMMRVQNAAHEIRVRAHDGGTRGIARDDVPDQLRQQPELTAQCGMGHTHVSYIGHGFVDGRSHCHSSDRWEIRERRSAGDRCGSGLTCCCRVIRCSGPPFLFGAPFQQKSLWISEVDPPVRVHDTVNFVASRAPERCRTVSGIPD